MDSGMKSSIITSVLGKGTWKSALPPPLIRKRRGTWKAVGKPPYFRSVTKMSMLISGSRRFTNHDLTRFARRSWFDPRAPIKNNPEQEVQDYFWQEYMNADRIFFSVNENAILGGQND
jgi:hypothetical protein